MGNKPLAKESDYIQKAKDGDIHAFRFLVDENKDILLSLAQSILKERSWAEDVLQDALIKVFHKIGSFREKSSFKTWLYRIIINSCYNELKKRKTYQALKEAAKVNQPSSVEHKNPLKAAERKLYIQAALDKLKADEALLLRLYYLCELSVGEIAESTGFKKAKIKTDLYRGRIHFKKELEGILGNEIREIL